MRGRLVARTLNTYSPAYLLSLSLDNVSTNNRFEGPPYEHPPYHFIGVTAHASPFKSILL